MVCVDPLMFCCCSYGAAVAGEVPEFTCRRCPLPLHRDLSHDDELCRRHRREKLGSSSG